METIYKIGVTVNVAECYLNDEVTENIDTSKTAIVVTEPFDEEELVGIQYKSGVLDYVPQDILEIKRTMYRIGNVIVYTLYPEFFN
jgi:hypothetical protein